MCGCDRGSSREITMSLVVSLLGECGQPKPSRRQRQSEFASRFLGASSPRKPKPKVVGHKMKRLLLELAGWLVANPKEPWDYLGKARERKRARRESRGPRFLLWPEKKVDEVYLCLWPDGGGGGQWLWRRRESVFLSSFLDSACDDDDYDDVGDPRLCWVPSVV